MGYLIRNVVDNDLKIIQQIESQSYSDPWPKSVFQLVRNRSIQGLFLVAEEDGNVIGYAIGEMEHYNKRYTGHLLNIAVDERWRGKGIGKALLHELELRFKQQGALSTFLEVRVSNIVAQQLYTRFGYIIAGKLDMYYRNEDGYLMKKML